MQNEFLKLAEILQWSKGKLIHEKRDTFDFIGTDTRADLSGKLFIPLRGESFDGHSFLKIAVDKGCAGIIFDRKSQELIQIEQNSQVTLIEVEDTLHALQEIAHGYRKKINKKILAITGSSGKTTTKEFSYQILNTFQKTYASQGSLNNHWGVPFSLLNMRSTDQLGVIEMGMNNYGEIQRLVEITDPDVVVCTMVGHAHFEHFGSQDNIAKAKEEIYKYSKKEAIRIYNSDNVQTKKMLDSFIKSASDTNVIVFSETDQKAQIFMQLKSVSSAGLSLEGHIAGHPGKALVPIFGKHNMTNILAASALALAVGMQPNKIWSVIGSLKTNWGRNQLLKADTGAQIIFDGYNANPDSMESLIENVRNTPVTGKRVLILGEMLELGETKGQFHFELGKKIKERGFDEVVFFGPSFVKFKEAFAGHTNKMQVWATEKLDEALINKIKNDFKEGDLIAIKGSRGMKTEKVVSLLVQTFSHEKI